VSHNSASRSGIQIESLENRKLLSVVPVSLPLTAETLHQSPLILEYNQIGFVGDMAHFTGGNTDWTQAAQLPSATISWGDHQTQTDHIAVFAMNATTLGVGSYLAHFYTKPGTYRITTVLRKGTTIIGLSTNAVRVSRTTPGGKVLTASAKVPFSGSLGIFTSTGPLFTNSSSVAEVSTWIDWGDNTSANVDPPATNISRLGTNRYEVHGNHVYKKPGTYVIQVETVPESIEAVRVAIDLVSRIQVK
jgi:hypothetical protein